MTGQQSFKSGFKNRQIIANENFFCGSEFQKDGADNWKARLEKSVFMNFGPAAGWQMNVKFGCMHVLQFLPFSTNNI